ncbi:MAG: matrixin family metalloprotease [Deltaproteobacteria bacterium]|nr:matrixin family metalloprotease [Deltaproteobacteria bacterium]
MNPDYEKLCLKYRFILKCFNGVWIFLSFLYIFQDSALSYPAPVGLSHDLIRWPIEDKKNIITYEVKTDQPDYLDYYQILTDIAAGQWTDVPGSLLILSPVEQGLAEITLSFQQTIDAPFSAGYAEFDQITDDGIPEHCRIYILTADRLNQDQLLRVILHETGHCLGLGHSLIPEAVMSYRSDNRTSLDLDDMAALSRLYPYDEAYSLPPGCGIGAYRSQASYMLLTILIFLPFLLIAVWMFFFRAIRSLK